jgi:hypothetical protein
MAVSPFASGRAGSANVQIQIEGLYPALKKWAAADPMFNKEIRSASVDLMNQLLPKIMTAAQSVEQNPKQAIESARGFRARPDRIPVLRLNAGSNFVSTTRPNRKRKRKVTRGDVFFGSEFGSNRLTQFPRRSPRYGSGNRGYWFWPTIEGNAETVNKEYIKALDRITNNLAKM